jgi:hypothetical protein
MRLADRVLERVRRRLLKSEIGIVQLRFLRWAIARVAPYTPLPADIPPERARAYVKVEVKPSRIPGAGHGLFALERVEARVVIGEYAGDIVDSVFKVFRLRNKDHVALTDDPSIALDPSRRPEVMMRYICHHPDAARRNVQYINEGSRKYVRTFGLD